MNIKKSAPERLKESNPVIDHLSKESGTSDKNLVKFLAKVDEPFMQVLSIAFNSRGATEDETIWHQMLAERLDFCKNDCESNRVVCILRPKCEDRRYLDILMLNDEFRKKLPEFCYGTRIDHLIKAESREHIPNDIYILLDDFISVLTRKKQKKRPFSSSLLNKALKSVKKSNYLKESNYMVIEANELQYLVFLSQGLVLVNPQKTIIPNLDVFTIMIRFYAEKNDCTSKVIHHGQFVEVILQSRAKKSPFRELGKLPLEILDYITEYSSGQIGLEFEVFRPKKGLRLVKKDVRKSTLSMSLTFGELKFIFGSIFS